MLTAFVQEPKKRKNVPMNTSFPYRNIRMYIITYVCKKLHHHDVVLYLICNKCYI